MGSAIVIVPIPIVVGVGSIPHSRGIPMLVGEQGNTVGGLFDVCSLNIRQSGVGDVEISYKVRSHTWEGTQLMVIVCGVLEQEAKRSPTRACEEEVEFKGSGEPPIHHQLPGSFLCSPSNGGDSRDLAKRSAHPKLHSEQSCLGFVEEGPKSV
jgi:hypothetical protein